MMVGYEFPGDFNDALKFGQNEVYGNSISLLYLRCKADFIDRNESKVIDFDLLQRVSQIEHFDHRVLQRGHDLIAAFYRFNFDYNKKIPLDLEKVTRRELRRYKDLWMMFFNVEANGLAADPKIRIAVLTAVAYANKLEGRNAEKSLFRLLKKRYGEFTAFGWLRSYKMPETETIDFMFENRFKALQLELPTDEAEIASGLISLEGVSFPLYVMPDRKNLFRIRKDLDGHAQADRWGTNLRWEHGFSLRDALTGELITVNRAEEFIQISKQLSEIPEKYSPDSLIEMAIEVATVAHQGQVRKGTETPYITHPISVGMHLMRASCPDWVVAAGILHDTVEDTFIDIGYIKRHFGKEITSTVARCSEPDKKLPWKERKQHSIKLLRKAPLEAKMVVCADKLSNIKSIIAGFKESGEDIWSRFNAGKDDQEWYYRNVVSSLKRGRGGGWRNFILLYELETELDCLFGNGQA